MASLLDRTTHRPVSWRYIVKFDPPSFKADSPLTQFTECSGLTVERETKVISEGGRPDYQFKLPGQLKYTNVTLKHGLIDVELLDWLIKYQSPTAHQANSIEPALRTVIIELADESGVKAFTWTLYHAYPVKWTGPSLNVTSSEISMEELELAYTYFVLEKADAADRMTIARAKLSAANPLG